MNGRRVNIASYLVKEGDVVQLRDRLAADRAGARGDGRARSATCRNTWRVDHSKMTVEFVRTPTLSDVPYPVMMEPNLVVEYYAKN